MRILIKAYEGTYGVLNHLISNPGTRPFISHVAPYWNFMLKDIFTNLGHEVKFIGPRYLKGINHATLKEEEFVVTDSTGYDLLFYHELESFTWDKDFALQLLKDFKGKKAFYIPTVHYENKEIMDQFDYIFPADAPQYMERWQKDFPNKQIHLLPWHAPELGITKQDCEGFKLNPPGTFKLIYTGILIDKYLDMIIKLAEKGETVYVGAIYHKTGEKSIRAFTPEEVKSFHPNIQLLSDSGMFNFGDQFKYIRAADLGLVFYPIDGMGCLKHKLVEYLCCGLPSVVEDPTPNGFRVKEVDGGQVFRFNDFDDLYRIVQEEKALKRNRQEIERKSWEIFDPVNFCRQLLNIVSA